MKITTIAAEGSQARSPTDRLKGGGAAQGGDAARSAGGSATGSDRVDLSNVAADLAAAIEAGANDDSIQAADPVRLAALRDAIARGEYTVDVRALAEAILNDDQPVQHV